MVWVDGQLAVTKQDFPGYRGHAFTDGGTSYSATVRRSVLPLEPGPVAVRVSCWETGTGAVLWRDATVAVTGTPSPFVLPIVVTGATLWPRVRRSLFHTRPDQVQSAGHVAAFHAAGVTHLETGAFNSPADNGAGSLSAAVAAWNTVIRPLVDAAVADGFRVVAIGDDMQRESWHRQFMLNTPWAGDFVQHVAAYLASTGCDGVEMADEANPDPSVYEGVPELVRGWWQEAGGPGQAWPVIAKWAPPYEWDDPDHSDYSSRYLITGQEWRNGRPFNALTEWQWRKDIKRAAGSLPAWPWCCLVPCTGPAYRKRVAGGDYQPGDVLDNAGVTGQNVIACVWLALAYGASGLRCYGYDFPNWAAERLAEPVGSAKQLQTGSKPGDARWAGLSAAFNAIMAREAVLCAGPSYTPTESGPWVFGRRGPLVWGVNTSERPLPSPNGSGTVLTPAGEVVGATVPAGGVILWAFDGANYTAA